MRFNLGSEKKNLKTSEEIDSERKIILQITEKLSNKKRVKKKKNFLIWEVGR